MKYLFVAALCVVLTGCSSEPERPSLETEILAAYNKALAGQGQKVRGTKLTLDQQGESVYVGKVTLDDGSSLKMTVKKNGTRHHFETTPLTTNAKKDASE